MSTDPTSIVAGTVEIPVESETKGFGEQLRAKIEKEIKGLSAKIGVEIVDKDLRREIKTSVKTAAEGVDAEVGVSLKTKGLRSKLEAALTQASAGLVVKVGVDLDTDHLRSEVTAATKAAGAGQKVRVGFEVNSTGLRQRLSARVKAASAGLTAKVRLAFTRNPADKAAKAAGGLRGAKDLVAGAGAAAGGGGGGSSGGIGGAVAKLGSNGLGRFTIMATMLTSLLSLLGPLIAMLGAGIGGLASMLANLAVSTKTIAALPTMLYAVVGAAAAGMIAFNGFAGAVAGAEGAMDGLPKSMQKAAREARVFKKHWRDLKTTVQDNFWRNIVGHIKPFADAVMPALTTALGQFGGVLGDIGASFLDWMATEEWGDEFNLVMRDALGLLRKLGPAALNFSKWLGDISVAASPLISRFGDLILAWSELASGAFDTYGEKSELSARLEYAADKGAQLGRILREAWQVISGVFEAGRETGDRLLGGFEKNLTGLADWVNSPDGAAKIKQWFADIEPLAEQVGLLLGDLVKVILDLSTNPAMVDLVKKLRRDLLPALTEFLDNLGAHLGPQVIDFIAQLVELLTYLASEDSGLVKVFEAVNGALTGINAFLDSNPDAASKLSGIVGALLGFGLLAPLLGKAGVFKLLGGALSSLFGAGIRMPGRGGRGGNLLRRTGGAGGTTGLGGAAGAAGAGRGGGFLSRLFSQQVFWTRPMPVFVTNPGGMGGMGGRAGRNGLPPVPGARPTGGGRPGSGGRTGRMGRIGGGGGFLGGIVAMLAGQAISDAMQDGNGGGRDLGASVIGSATSYGGMGSMFGPFGAMFGALAGIADGVTNFGADNDAYTPGKGRGLQNWASTNGFMQSGPVRGFNNWAAGIPILKSSIFGQAGLVNKASDAQIEALGPGRLLGAGAGSQSGAGAATPTRTGSPLTPPTGPRTLTGSGSSTGFLVANAAKDAKDAAGVLTNFANQAPRLASPPLHAAGAKSGSSLNTGLRGPLSGALRVLTGFKSQAPKSVQANLAPAGSGIIASLRKGMESRFESIKTTLGNLTRLIPNWKGPAGLDAVLLKPAGALIIGGLRSSMEAEYGSVRSSLSAFTNSLGGVARSPRLGAATLGGVEAAGEGGKGGVYYAPGSVNIKNPEPERASTSLSTQMRRGATFKSSTNVKKKG